MKSFGKIGGYPMEVPSLRSAKLFLGGRGVGYENKINFTSHIATSGNLKSIHQSHMSSRQTIGYTSQRQRIVKASNIKVFKD